ncbi:amidase family protein [Sedimentitalea todarodis]|uniref:Amidase family protein n=1 Tax=Sedimentitalea todarodis TaxID=1631240 RepID=A0ABU3VCN3_9RHOB|nr:amidase family protein [Sedimentitalea todarodis]MDU9003927.1 amidase family protein [Sedimentitalea todarodis]
MTQLWKSTASALAQAVRCKQVSAIEVTQAHLDRADAINALINAVVDSFHEESLDAAGQVDAQIARGQDPGPLCGVPVTIKVNVDQQRHATTNGLKLQENLVALEDNPVVSNLRKAGAVIIGRTNTPAFSLRWFTRNNLHGQTLNPRDPSITPGGSSGGAGAAVAAGLCAIGHGTDIAGSVRYPAYACGLHGLRPSLGRVPAHNATGGDRFIGAQMMAVSGPLARSIEDIRLSLAAMSARDPRDPWQTVAPLDQGPFEKRAALTLVPDGMEVADDVQAALLDAAERLRDAGWTVDQVDCPPMQEAARINAILWMAENQFAAGDMIANEGEPDAMFVAAQMIADAGAIDLERVMMALKTRVGLIREWEQFLGRYTVLLCPVSGELPFEQQLDVRSEADFARVFRAQLTQRALPTLGLPGLSVATGQVNQIPVGVQLIAGRFREDVLFAAGTAIEQAGPAIAIAEPNA